LFSAPSRTDSLFVPWDHSFRYGEKHVPADVWQRGSQRDGSIVAEYEQKVKSRYFTLVLQIQALTFVQVALSLPKFSPELKIWARFNPILGKRKAPVPCRHRLSETSAYF
jgi:hypothetical protein